MLLLRVIWLCIEIEVEVLRRLLLLLLLLFLLLLIVVVSGFALRIYDGGRLIWTFVIADGSPIEGGHIFKSVIETRIEVDFWFWLTVFAPLFASRA